MKPPVGVFVYGTLRAAAPAGGMLGPVTRLEARVRGRLYDLPEGYPALVPVEGDEWVYGEIALNVSDRVLGLLDLYEGVDEGLYYRVVVEAWQGLRPVPAWAWVMDRPERRGGVLVPSGRWRPSRRR